MSFNSFLFYPIFIIIVIVNYALPKKWRWVVLLIASYIIYGLSDVKYVVILLLSTFISYLVGRMIAHIDGEKQKRIWMLAGLILTLSILFVFKYLNFFFEIVNTFLTGVGLHWSFRGMDLIFPIGISFYIFQQVSYITDVYTGKAQAEKNFGHYALFIAFFPKLLIGPIERYNHLMPQLVDPEAFKYQNFIDSLVRIAWGLFKKLVIADRLAVVSNTVFSAPQNFYSPQLILGVLAFTFQIYIDFSAYCDIAIGTAKILGIDLVENFDRPYFARSLTDFWRRWHISLSSWLRDYIFMPLDFKLRRKKPREFWLAVVMIITFLISGLWHGANWTFLVWGGLHGLYQAVEIVTQKKRDLWAKKRNIDRNSIAHQILQIITTFTFVSFTWLFFKAGSLAKALPMLTSIITLNGTTSETAWIFNSGNLGLDAKDFFMMSIMLLVFLLIEALQGKIKLMTLLNQQPTWFRWIFYLGLIFSITIFGFYGENVPRDFVYFKF